MVGSTRGTRRLGMLSYRYGYGWLEKSLLTLWSIVWLTALMVVLLSGTVTWGEGEDAENYTRVGQPLAYWFVVSVIAGLCVVGLFLTFEWSGHSNKESLIKKNDSCKEPKA